MSFPNPEACAVRERTADGDNVGRCYFHTVGGMCPRHGDVAAVQRHYVETGRLTDERSLNRLGALERATSAGRAHVGAHTSQRHGSK
jgi:hypothetical protein